MIKENKKTKQENKIQKTSEEKFKVKINGKDFLINELQLQELLKQKIIQQLKLPNKTPIGLAV